jgi:alpha-N-arabinofuranosidase
MMKIAAGLGGSDHNGEDLAVFMDRVMNRRHNVTMDGVSIHFYVFFPQKPEHSATEFTEKEWFEVLHEANVMDHVIKTNAAILDEYDPEKKMWLIVDEWGAWYPVEAGTNPAFLYQQNSMRDAVVAALTLHIFQDHCDRVQMANLAQTVNVIQALFLTDGEKMILTPTYHVFDMFKGHQDATALSLDLEVAAYEQGEQSLPMISASASKSEPGEVLLTLTNLHPNQAVTLDCDISGMDVSSVRGTILVDDDITAHNTFDAPNRVQPKPFTGAGIVDGGTLKLDVPAASVIALQLK